MLVPKLRFKEFTDEWEWKNLSSISDLITKGTTPKKYQTFGINFIKVENIHNNIIDNINSYISDETHNVELKRSRLKEKDILFSIAGALGRTAIVNKDILPANTNQACSIIRLNNFQNIDISYLINRLNNNDICQYIKKCQSVGAQPNLSLEQVNNILISLPSFKEQEKIGNVLSLLDKKTELQSKKIEALKLYKKYTRDSLLENNEDIIYLKDILTKWNKKNRNNSVKYVESISNKYGFISQSEQFEDRIVASNNLNNYYVIKKNVFAYNPSRLNVGSLALKDDDKECVISPLYECFTTNQNNHYMLEWFESKYFKKQTYSKYEGGVRNTLNFNNLCTIKIGIPSIGKQEKISNVLLKINNTINLEHKKLLKLQALKKGLMQNMFA